MYIYIYIYFHKYTWIHIYIYIHTYTYTYTYIHIYICIYMRVFTYLSQYPKDVGTARCWLQDVWISFGDSGQLYSSVFLPFPKKIHKTWAKNREKKQVTRSPKSYFAMDSVGYILNFIPLSSPMIWSIQATNRFAKVGMCEVQQRSHALHRTGTPWGSPKVLRHVNTVFTKRPRKSIGWLWKKVGGKCANHTFRKEVQKIPIQIVVRCFDVNRCSLI